MSEKKLSKAKLERVVELTMDIHDHDKYASIDENVKRRFEASQSVYATDTPYFYWYIIDFVEGVRAFAGEDADLWESLCKALEVLGWQVVDDEQSDG